MHKTIRVRTLLIALAALMLIVVAFIAFQVFDMMRFRAHIWDQTDVIQARIELREAQAPPEEFFTENRQALEYINELVLANAAQQRPPEEISYVFFPSSETWREPGLDFSFGYSGAVALTDEQLQLLEAFGHVSIALTSSRITYTIGWSRFIYVREAARPFAHWQQLDENWYTAHATDHGWGLFIDNRDRFLRINDIALAQGAGEHQVDELPLPDDLADAMREIIADAFWPDPTLIIRVSQYYIAYDFGREIYFYTFDGNAPASFRAPGDFRGHHWNRSRLDDNWFLAQSTSA